MDILPYPAQIELLKALLTSRAVCLELDGLLLAKHFTNPSVGAVAHAALSVFRTYGQPATEGQMREVLDKIPGNTGLAAIGVLSEALVADQPPDKWAVEKGHFLAAASETLQLGAAARTFAADGRFDEFCHRAREVASLASPRGETTIGMGDVEARHGQIIRAIPTKTPMDKILPGGGFPYGWYSLGLALKGGGKSQMMAHVAAAALEAEKRVGIVTLEMTGPQFRARIDRRLAKQPDKDPRDPHSGRSPFLDWFGADAANRELLREAHDRLIIMEATRRPLTISGLEAWLDRLPWEIDILCVDYIQLMQLGSFSAEDAIAGRRQGLADISKDFHIIAQQRGFHLATVYQANRVGYAAQDNPDLYLEPRHISESIGVHYPAEIVYSINQTLPEWASSQGRLAVCENREGPKNKVFPCTFRWDMSYIEDIYAGAHEQNAD